MATFPGEPPAATWSWRTDQGKWSPYSDELCLELEVAFSQGVARLPVDSERYVDTVKMEQRRTDLTGKPRAVMRKPKLILGVFTFVAVGNIGASTVQLITKHGGVITHHPTPKANVFLCDEPNDNVNMLKLAKAAGIIVAYSNGIPELIKNPSIATLKPFQHNLSLLLGPVPPNPFGAAPKTNGNVVAANGMPQLPKPDGIPWKDGYSRPLDSSTEWMGSWMYKDSTMIPIVLDVTYVFPTGEYLAVLKMPTKATQIQARGILVPLGGPAMENGEISHTIYLKTECNMTGKDQSLTNKLFKGHLDTVQRMIRFQDGLAPIILNYVRHFPVPDLAFLQPGTTWHGSAVTDISDFSLSVQSSSSSGFQGQVSWTDLQVTTACKGTYGANGEVRFEETELLKKPDDEDFEVPPAKYVCLPRRQLVEDPPSGSVLFTGTVTADLGNGVSSNGTFILSKP